MILRILPKQIPTSMKSKAAHKIVKTAVKMTSKLFFHLQRRKGSLLIWPHAKCCEKCKVRVRIPVMLSGMAWESIVVLFQRFGVFKPVIKIRDESESSIKASII